MSEQFIIIGSGAPGFFCAINAARMNRMLAVYRSLSPFEAVDFVSNLLNYFFVFDFVVNAKHNERLSTKRTAKSAKLAFILSVWLNSLYKMQLRLFAHWSVCPAY
jgi:hypothetical protein